MDDSAPKHERTDPVVAETERPEPAAPGDVDDAAQDDFAARNVLMTNAFGGGASPFAGALIGNKDKMFEPTTAEERGELEPESKATRVEPVPGEDRDTTTDPRGA